MTVTAYAPSHITAFFSIVDSSQNEGEKGSVGAGFCLSKGVTTTVTRSTRPLSVFINGKAAPEARTSLALLALLAEHFPQRFSDNPDFHGLTIHHQIDLPGGSGFGTSGAGAFSLALALNSFFSMHLTTEAAAQWAHFAELRAQTGLGTVAGEWLGGMEIRETAGPPGIASLRSLPFPPSLRCHLFYWGPFDTPTALADCSVREKITRAGKTALACLPSLHTPEALMETAHRFSVESELMPPPMAQCADAFYREGLPTAMLMFGEGLYFLYTQETREKSFRVLNQMRSLRYIKRCREWDVAVDPIGGRLL